MLANSQMLDVASCPHAPHSEWVVFTWRVSVRLSQPLPLSARLALLTLAVVAVLLLFLRLRQASQRKRLWLWLQRFRWNRRRTQIVVALTLICLLVTSPPGLSFLIDALSRQVPADSGAKADAIVILGRGWRLMNDRADVAANLWQANRAPSIFVSGGGRDNWIPHQLLKKGIPSDAIGGENCSTTTEENAQFTAKALLPQGAKRIILVTDSPHMVRSRLTFQSLGFEVIAHSSSLPTDLAYRERLELILREYGGILTYVFKGRFHERESAAIDNHQDSVTNH